MPIETRLFVEGALNALTFGLLTWATFGVVVVRTARLNGRTAPSHAGRSRPRPEGAMAPCCEAVVGGGGR